MKKWLITGLVALALVAAGVWVRSWLRFLPFFRQNSDLIQGLSSAVQMVLWVGAGLAGKTRTAAPQKGQNEPHYHPKQARATCG